MIFLLFFLCVYKKKKKKKMNSWFDWFWSIFGWLNIFGKPYKILFLGLDNAGRPLS